MPRGLGLGRRVVAVLVGALSALAAGCGGVRKAPAPTGSGGPLKVLAFYDDRAEKPSGTVLPLIAANRAAIWELAPLWYRVMADGSVTDQSEADVKGFARTHGIQLMPLVINASGTSAFLVGAGSCTTGPCANAVAQLAAIVQRENYDGLNIDFELLKPQARSGLTAFVAQLHGRLTAMHRTLTVDVIPAGSRRQAEKAYDFAALAKNSDDIVLMSYDAHDDTSAPGPIAPLSWVKKRVNVALSLGVPRNKLILGLADYGYDWTVPHHGVTIGLKDAHTLIQQRGITISRTADGSPHFTYTSGGAKHVVWYEDGRSILPKIQLAREDGLKGLALWMAGYETAQYWTALRTAAGTLSSAAATSGSAPAASAPSSSASSAGGSSSAHGSRSTAGASSTGAPSGSSASAPSGRGSSASSSS